MFLRLPLLLTLIGLLGVLPHVAFAGEEKPKERTFEDRVLGVGDSLEDKIGWGAEKIDIILAGRKYTKKKNESHLDINQTLTHTAGGRFSTSTDFGLNLRLPNIEKRWQLRFTSYDEERESRDLQQKRVRTRPRAREYNAGLLFFQRLGRVKTSFLPRLQLKDPLDVSYLLRFEYEAGTKFKVIPRVDLFADPKKGTGEYASLEFRWEATNRLEWSLTSTEEYREKENFFTTQHSLGADYALNDHQGVGAAITGVSTNRPKMHLDTLTFSTGFANVIYRDRLSFSITPFLAFGKNVAFKGNPGISVAIDLNF